jgi:hypothetical protein
MNARMDNHQEFSISQGKIVVQRNPASDRLALALTNMEVLSKVSFWATTVPSAHE